MKTRTHRFDGFILAGFLVFVWFLGATGTEAATLRTTTITSGKMLAVSTSTATVHTQANTPPVGIFSISVALRSFKADAMIPLAALESEVATSAERLGYTIESRYAEHDPGITASLVTAPYGTIEDGFLMIPKGTSGTFTLLVGYLGTALPDRQDRLRITNLPILFPGSGTSIFLNQFELEHAKTAWVELAP